MRKWESHFSPLVYAARMTTDTDIQLSGPFKASDSTGRSHDIKGIRIFDEGYGIIDVYVDFAAPIEGTRVFVVDDNPKNLSLLAEILGGGATSRYYDQLVRGDGPATYAGASYQSSGLDDTRFIVYGMPKPGTDLPAVLASLFAPQYIDAVLATVTQEWIAKHPGENPALAMLRDTITPIHLDDQSSRTYKRGRKTIVDTEPDPD